jgi:hypothetical protein
MNRIAAASRSWAWSRSRVRCIRILLGVMVCCRNRRQLCSAVTVVGGVSVSRLTCEDGESKRSCTLEEGWQRSLPLFKSGLQSSKENLPVIHNSAGVVGDSCLACSSTTLVSLPSNNLHFELGNCTSEVVVFSVHSEVLS